MAVKQNEVFISRVASGDISASQYLVMKPATTAGEVKLVAATTDAAIGILDNDPDAQGKAARIQVGGVAKMVASTSVGWTDGVAVGFAATGKAIPTSTDNSLIVGHFYTLTRGQTTTVAADQVISVQLIDGLPLRN